MEKVIEEEYKRKDHKETKQGGRIKVVFFLSFPLFRSKAAHGGMEDDLSSCFSVRPFIPAQHTHNIPSSLFVKFLFLKNPPPSSIVANCLVRRQPSSIQIISIDYPNALNPNSA